MTPHQNYTVIRLLDAIHMAGFLAGLDCKPHKFDDAIERLKDIYALADSLADDPIAARNLCLACIYRITDLKEADRRRRQQFPGERQEFGLPAPSGDWLRQNSRSLIFKEER